MCIPGVNIQWGSDHYSGQYVCHCDAHNSQLQGFDGTVHCTFSGIGTIAAVVALAATLDDFQPYIIIALTLKFYS